MDHCPPITPTFRAPGTPPAAAVFLQRVMSASSRASAIGLPDSIRSEERVRTSRGTLRIVLTIACQV
jgi:hypothetical protein